MVEAARGLGSWRETESEMVGWQAARVSGFGLFGKERASRRVAAWVYVWRIESERVA